MLFSMINLQAFVSENLSSQIDNAILHGAMVTKPHFSMIIQFCEKNELMNSFFFTLVPPFVCFSKDVFVKFLVFDNIFELFFKTATISHNVVKFES